MKIIINQFFGSGDIHYCMTIARRLQAQGHEITWPVLPQFVDGFTSGFPDIKFISVGQMPIDYNKQYEHDWNGYRVLPLRFNVEITKVPYSLCMASKYSMFEWDYKDWKEGAMWERDSEKESDLLNLVADGYDYVLINNRYQSDGKGHRKINEVKPYHNVIMQELPMYSIFDWAKVLENATEIHTVSTSLLYILEILDLKCPIHLYSRPTDPNFDQVSYLFTKPYILHYD